MMSDVVDMVNEEGPGLVDTPETRSKPEAAGENAAAPRPRRARKPKPEAAAEGALGDGAAEPSEAAE
jgi:hypothetical protein